MMHNMPLSILEYTTSPHFYAAIGLMFIGLYGIVHSGNLVKKILCLAIFQTAILLFYIALAYVEGGSAPIHNAGIKLFVNPLPHVLMLTAIVVGVSVMSVGLALCMRIKNAYGTVEEKEIRMLSNAEASKPKTSKR